MNAADLYARCDAEFAARHAAVDGRWETPTALPGWDVRALVRHVVDEQLWAPPLFAGRTIAEIGEPAATDDPAATALAAVRAPGALEQTVHLSFGDVPGAEYARQLAADHLVHAWDLARALGGDEKLDPEAVNAVAAWFDTAEEAYRGAGVIGPRVPVDDDADAQTRLLARFGRAS